MLASEVPSACPQCDYPFSPIRLQPRWQKKAVGLFLAGLVLTPAWIGFLVYLATVHNQLLVPHGGGGVVGILGVYLAPAFLAGFLAFQVRRVVALQCRKCGWSRVCLIDRSRSR
jgi:hypothetical protein